MKVREWFSLVVLAGGYLLCSVRYFPGLPAKTAAETLLQIVSVAPLPGGATIILVNFLQRRAGQKMAWDRMLRIYLTVGLMVELLYGLHDYLGKAS